MCTIHLLQLTEPPMSPPGSCQFLLRRHSLWSALPCTVIVWRVQGSAALATINGGEGGSSAAASLIQELWGELPRAGAGGSEATGLCAALLYAGPPPGAMPAAQQAESVRTVHRQRLAYAPVHFPYQLAVGEARASRAVECVLSKTDIHMHFKPAMPQR
jgi:hypothetical protein